MTNKAIARTGRVQNWIDDPTSRLPVSCTVFVVEDSMEGRNGIEASWRFVSHALRFGAGVAVHLSKIRPEQEELKTAKDLLLQAQSHLAKSIAASMNNYAEAVSTKTEQLCSTSTLTTQTSLSSSTLQELNCPGQSVASTSGQKPGLIPIKPPGMRS